MSTTSQRPVLGGQSQALAIVALVQNTGGEGGSPSLGVLASAYSVVNKRAALDVIRASRTSPKNLHLKRGEVKELATGVFAKQGAEGTLEIYISEE